VIRQVRACLRGRVDVKRVLVLLVLVIGARTVNAELNSEREVRRTINTFLEALTKHDLRVLRSCWADSPVAFLPVAGAESGKRLDTEADFLKGWTDLFERGRQTQAQTNQSVKIEPKDTRIDFVTPDVAVVTFHLTANPQSIGRRMFVVRRAQNGWKITHLHASNMPVSTSR
jgi:ketosteroid isomerase-like protein